MNDKGVEMEEAGEGATTTEVPLVPVETIPRQAYTMTSTRPLTLRAVEFIKSALIEVIEGEGGKVDLSSWEINTYSVSVCSLAMYRLNPAADNIFKGLS